MAQKHDKPQATHHKSKPRNKKIKAFTVSYAKENLCGWAGFDVAKKAYEELAPTLQAFSISGPVADYKGKRQMLWEFTRKVLGKDTENFPQETGDCFPAGTMVRMADGSEKSIESIQIGEMIMTAQNRSRPVTATIEKSYTGELVTIRSKGQPRSVTATPDHRIRTVKPEGDIWSPISELKIKDKVLLPSGLAEKETLGFDVSIGIEGSFKINKDNISTKHGSICNRHIPLSEDLGWLIGIYLAEGGVTKDSYGRPTRIDFNLGSHEVETAQKVKKVIESIFGISAKITNVPSKPTVIYVRVDNVVFARFIKKLIPGNTYSKRIPKELMAASDKVRLALLRGWIEGDGHERVTGNCPLVCGVSVSLGLTQDFYHICISLGLKTYINYRKPSSKRRRAASLSMYGESAMTVVPILRNLIDWNSKTIPFKNRSDLVDQGTASTIKEIDKYHTDTIKVYCLEICQDHSFVANGYAVHNCVSFSGKNVMEYLQCVQMVLNKSVEEFHPLFPPYFYGTSRVLVGQNQLGYEQGSTGTWLQEAIKNYGVLRRDNSNVPQYSGSIATNWGGQGPPENFLTEGKTHVVKTTARITNVDDAAIAILNGYPVSVCSNQGFTMQAASDGFHQPRGTWGHAMTLIGFEDHPQFGLYFIILNSWGDVHGTLKDFTTGEDLPIGILRVKSSVVKNMLSMNDSYAYSGFDGFPDNSNVLNKALFDMGGD